MSGYIEHKFITWKLGKLSREAYTEALDPTDGLNFLRKPFLELSTRFTTHPIK